MGYYPPRVTLCDDGIYRWSCEMDRSTNGAPFWGMIKVCAIIGCVILIPCLLLGGFMILMGLIVLAGMVILPVLAWLLLYHFSGDSSIERFEMNDEYVTLVLRKQRGITKLSNVRKVKVFPVSGLIELHSFGLINHISVPDEDFDFVKEFILSRVPEKAEIEIVK